MTFRNDEQRKAAFAKKRVPAAKKAPRTLWVSRRTGLGKFEVVVAYLLGGALEMALPYECRSQGVVSMDTWNEALRFPFKRFIKGFPARLEVRNWSDKQKKAVQAAVRKILAEQGMQVVETQCDLVQALARQGKLTSAQLFALPNLSRISFSDYSQVMRYAMQGYSLYTIQPNGRVLEAANEGKGTFVAVKEAA